MRADGRGFPGLAEGSLHQWWRGQLCWLKPRPNRRVALGRLGHADDGAIVHAERHGSQPGRGAVRRDDPALLPLVEFDYFHERYAGRYGQGERTRRSGQQRRVHLPERAFERGDVLLRFVRGPRKRRERYRHQLLHGCTCDGQRRWRRRRLRSRIDCKS